MELALGTVQFGLAYGIAGRGTPVPEGEVRAILRRAWDGGVRWLDTAAAYGDIEHRLARLADGLGFKVVSKIPAVPETLSPEEAARWAVDQARTSRARLGRLLAALMCHRADDLRGDRGTAVWQALQRWSSDEGVALGASFYDPASCAETHRERGIAVAQVPANTLDQRLARTFPAPVPGLALHLRSVFLQGLLLMPEAAAAARMPAAAGPLRAWHRWREARGLSAPVAALSVAQAFRAAGAVVVGVDSDAQCADILQAWSEATPLTAAELACDDAAVIDPRNWTTA